MTILDILRQPTEIESRCDIALYHESLTRSFHVAVKAGEWARAGVPGDVLAEWIDFLQQFRREDVAPRKLEVINTTPGGAA